MGVPAVLVDFPAPSSDEHAARAQLLGRQWPVFWRVGNVFFRPISTLGIFGYGYAAWVVASSISTSTPLSSSFLASSTFTSTSTAGAYNDNNNNGNNALAGDWRIYALSALCHLVTVVHSAVNMQPINEKLNALSGRGDGSGSGSGSGLGGKPIVQVDSKLAEFYARKWIRYNTVRLITPVVAGTLALTQVLRR
jgi:hypothetical protein